MRALRRAVETDLGELTRIAWQRRWWLLGAGSAAALAALVISYFIAPRYHSSASILPAKGFLQDRAIVVAPGEFREAVELRPTTASNSQNMVTAASYLVRRAIVDQLGLVDFFGHGRTARGNPELAAQRAMDDLRSATHFELSVYRDVLIVHATTRDPEMSARIANLYVDMIQAENLARYRRQAMSQAAYIREQITVLHTRILAVTDSLVAFYETHGVVSIEKERDTLLSLMQSLLHQRSSIALTLARESADRSPQDPEVLRLSAQLALYDELLARFSPGGSPTGARSLESLLEPAVELRGKEIADRLESLQEQERSLRASLTVAMMEGEREEALLPVMDRAFPASEPSWPRRWLLMIGSATIVVGSLYAAFVFGAAIRALAREGSP